MSEPFIAEVKIFAGNFAPRSWAFCDGQILPISQNDALFSLIGTVYGGDGRTTMGLPNLQGRAPMHPGSGPGLTTRQLGDSLGASTVTLTESQIPQHSHTLRSFATTPTTATPSGAVGLAAIPIYGDASATKVDMASDIVEDTGGNSAHNNMQPYLGLHFIIALQGIFPSRS